MRFRFLYLGASGGQTEVASLDDLRGLIEEGTIGEVTPLFDALTEQWAPARAHAVYRLLIDDARSSYGVEREAAAAPLPDLGLTVTASALAEHDTDQAVRDMMRERERERDGDEATARRANPSVNPASWGARVEPSHRPEPDVRRSAPATFVPAPRVGPPRPPESVPRARSIAPTTPVPSPVQPPSADALRASAVPAPTPDERPRLLATPIQFNRLRRWGSVALRTFVRLAGHERAPAVMVALGIGGLLVILLSAVRVSPAGAEATTPDPVPDVRGLVARFATAEDSGFRYMVAGIDSLRRAYDVVVVPPVWLEGRYLADAGSHPEVKEYWLRYRDFLRAVHASDRALFRAGFAAQLRDDGVDGPVLSLRLSQAMSGFEQTQPVRSSMYAHMEELAAASLALHALLVEREADISYEPAFDRRLSRDPVVEALAVDTVLRDRMWVLLDRIFASLEQLGGNMGANRDNLTEALLEGVEASQH